MVSFVLSASQPPCCGYFVHPFEKFVGFYFNKERNFAIIIIIIILIIIIINGATMITTGEDSATLSFQSRRATAFDFLISHSFVT